MAETSFPEIHRHRLSHIHPLRVDSAILEPIFAESCSVAHCNAHCCREGVLVDLGERDAILHNAETIKKYLEPRQEHDPARWFESEESDSDFPSGRCAGTRTTDFGCVFLDSHGLCVLQTAATNEGMGRFALKPFYCVSYPLTIERGVLTVMEPAFANRTVCCSPVARGSRKVSETHREELEFMLGADGLRDFDGLISANASAIDQHNERSGSA